MLKENKITKIEINTTQTQKDEIKRLAKSSGKGTMSAYMLSKAFEQNNMEELTKRLKERNKIQEKIINLQIKMKQLDEEIINLIATIIDNK